MSAIPAFEPELVMTEAEYLAFEDASDTKHEFVDGHVYVPSRDFLKQQETARLLAAHRFDHTEERS